MYRFSQRVGYINVQRLQQAVTAGAVASIMLISLCLPLGAIRAEESAHTNLTDHSAAIDTAEVTKALATTGVAVESDTTNVSIDDDSAIQAATAGATIDIPRDASEGVTLADASGIPALDIALPNADSAADAQTVAPGVAAYAGTNGSANAVQATEDGGVRMLTIIDNPSAPTTYDYKVTVPNGGHIELTEDGGAVVLNTANQPIATVATPWAKDATGKQIETHFTTDGMTLTQYVKHNIKGVVYPVTADPLFLAISVPLVLYALRVCGVGAAVGVVTSYIKGDRSWSAMQGEAKAGCVIGIVGGWSKIKYLVVILKAI